MRATTSTSQDLPVSGLWAIEVCADDTPVVTVTLPDGSTTIPTVEATGSGRYRAEYAVAAAGRYVARAVGTDGARDFTAFVTATVAAQGMPVIEDVDTYLGAHSWADDDLQAALDAEAAAQRSVCRVPAAYPADLREALLRRVVRNLAMRALPLAMVQGDAEAGGATLLPGRDPEVRRLEAPHRKLVVG